MKVLCYGVRYVEKEIFEAVNKKYGYEMTLVPNYVKTKEDVMLAKGFDCVILRGNCRADKENLDLYKNLGVKYILTRTVGVDHIDVNYAKEIGLKTGFVPAYSPNSVAELAVTLGMTLLRNVAYTASKTARKNFIVDEQMFSKEIRNCTVGVVGIGRIGFTCARLFKGLGANVLAYDVFHKEGVEDICTQVSLDELISKSDIITLHCPYIKEVGKILTKDFIQKMKQGAILINTARGDLQDLDAILDGMESGKLGGVALDVLEGESAIFFKNLEDKEISDKRVEKLLKYYPRVLITPHVGSYTDEAVLNMVETSFENLREYLDNGCCTNEI